MLVLSRKCGERAVIGDGLCEVQVVDIEPHRVRLGFIADKSVSILRTEVPRHAAIDGLPGGADQQCGECLREFERLLSRVEDLPPSVRDALIGYFGRRLRVEDLVQADRTCQAPEREPEPLDLERH